MSLIHDSYQIIRDPDQTFRDKSATSILKEIARPFYIWVDGKNKNKTRVLSTLLHGNEPSGYFAFHHWLKQGIQPAVNVACFVTAVEAALIDPIFSHRNTIRGADLNRCFRPRLHSKEAKLANSLLTLINSFNPESIIDIHNTSGFCPHFGIILEYSRMNAELASLFTNALLIFDIKLHTLIEALSPTYPCIVIECGSPKDPEAFGIAYKGINEYLNNEFIDETIKHDIKVYRHPIRLEVYPDVTIGYGNIFHKELDLTLLNKIEALNANNVPKNTQLGWIGDKGLDIFKIFHINTNETIYDYFHIVDNQLLTKQDLRLFMVTTNIHAAKKDCLFYMVKNEIN